YLGADDAVDHRVLVEVTSGERIVAIAVDEPWHDALAARIHDPRRGTDKASDLLSSAYGENLPVAHRHGFGDGELLVDGQHLAVDDHQVGERQQLRRHLCGGGNREDRKHHSE